MDSSDRPRAVLKACQKRCQARNQDVETVGIDGVFACVGELFDFFFLFLSAHSLHFSCSWPLAASAAVLRRLHSCVEECVYETGADALRTLTGSREAGGDSISPGSIQHH